MTTVLRPDEQPRDNTQTKTQTSDTTALYGRATAGTNRTNDSAFGPPATDAPAAPGPFPGPDAYNPDLAGNQLVPDRAEPT